MLRVTDLQALQELFTGELSAEREGREQSGHEAVGVVVGGTHLLRDLWEAIAAEEEEGEARCMGSDAGGDGGGRRTRGLGR